MKKASALLFKTPGNGFRLAEFDLLPPGPRDVMLRMERSGLCGTDVHIAEGRLPLPAGEWIIGHELVGTVTGLGSEASVDGLGNPLSVGDRVIACVAVPCGKCASCLRGETASCMAFGVSYMKDPRERPHFHGGFAEYLHSPAAYLVRLPPGLDLDAVSAFPCGGPTVLRAFTYAGGLEKGELVVVQGTGPLGLFAVAWAASRGAVVVAIGSGSNPKRTELAMRLGAREVMDFRGTEPAARLARIKALADELGRGDGADLVIETSGSPAAFPEGLDLARTRGRYVVPGQYSNSGTVTIAPQAITFKALRITGSGQYTLADIAAYLEFLGTQPALAEIFASCVTRYPLWEYAQAFEASKAGRNLKTVFAGD